METPAFITNSNAEERLILRTNQEHTPFISIHSVEYLIERAQDEDDNEWEQFYEQYLAHDTETRYFVIGPNQFAHARFTEAVAYRVEGDATEYTREQMLELLNTWQPSFYGYTYWDGHNYIMQYTAGDEAQGWAEIAVEAAEQPRASTTWRGTRYALYGARLDNDFTVLLGESTSAAGERLTPLGSPTQAVAAVEEMYPDLRVLLRQELKDELLCRLQTLLEAERDEQTLDGAELLNARQLRAIDPDATSNLFQHFDYPQAVQQYAELLGQDPDELGAAVRAEFAATGNLLA